MLVVEPEKRYTLKQISQHRWMQCKLPSINDDIFTTNQADSIETTGNLDSIVINHMLQLPNLTFDEIAESVHQNTFNHIYAIYNLLVDKLQAKRNEQQRLQHHASLGYTKSVSLSSICVFFFNSIDDNVKYGCFFTDREKQVLQRVLLSVRKH